jgi:hypothetical protein
MVGLDEVKVEMHKLGLEIAGLRPIVQEVHNSMPRIVMALETLAGVTVRLEANTEDHRHLHERITRAEEQIKEDRLENMEEHRIIHRRINETDEIAKEAKDEFDALRDEHIVCTTTAKVTTRVEGAGLWAKIKAKVTDKALELVILSILAFISWMVVSHFNDFQKSRTATINYQSPGGVT